MYELTTRSSEENLTSLDEEKVALLPKVSIDQYPPFCHLEYPSTSMLSRCLAITRMKIAGILRKPGFHPWPGMKRLFVVTITPDHYPSESMTLKFIAENTTVPVPEVILAFTFKKMSYVVARKTSGESLSFVWDRLNQSEREDIQDQLYQMLIEIRNLCPPANIGVSNVAGGPIRNVCLPSGQDLIGPFPSIHDFNHYLASQLSRSQRQDMSNQCRSLRDEIRQPTPKLNVRSDDLCLWPARRMGIETSSVQACDENKEKPCVRSVFTHGNLTPRNVIVRGAKVVEIRGWEAAGWYPPRWELWSMNILRDRSENNSFPAKELSEG